MDNPIVKWAVNWGLARLGDRNTWITWFAVLAAHFGGVINPEFNTLLVNIALGIVAVIGYAVEGKPIYRPETKKELAR